MTTITDELHTCGCGDTFTINDLFGHECPLDRPQRSLGRIDRPEPVVNVDRPDHWSGGAKPSRPSGPARRNQYPGQCAVCGMAVAAEAGILARKGNNWSVRHDGACPTPPATPSPAPAPVRAPSPTLTMVPEGHYAIASTGTNDLAFYRVDHSEKWGISLKLIVGGKPDMFVRRANIAGILERIAADIEGARKRYADEFTRCYRCNRQLTDKTSRELGIGPECRSKAA